MSPIQQMLLGVGAVATKTYVDDIFSTTLYRGNMTDRNINTGIDMSGEGGLAWIYHRSGYGGWLFDTTRGYNKFIRSSNNAAESTETTMVSGFTSTGFSLDGDGSQSDNTNENNSNYTSWNFRKAPGFFTMCTWTGNDTNQSISHDLGCVPGMIICKSRTMSRSWMVYHRGTDATAPEDKYLKLNDNVAVADAGTWNDFKPTSTTFQVGASNGSNENGQTYIAYLFAGGESTNALARSVDFDGSGDYLSVASSADLTFGTGDFTIEFWANPDDFDTRGTLYDSRPSGGSTGITIGHESSSGEIRVYMIATSGSDIVVESSDFERGQWQHIAVTRSSGTVRLFINGTLKDSGTRTSDLNNTNAVNIGYKTYTTSSYDYFDGKISNFRVVKGTAVYTSSFKPPTEPLTNITNTKLLCCNDSSTTGSTVTPGTITANGDPTASTDSPFDDPAGFVFGDAEDQNVIKCGSWTQGSGVFTAYLGWEPQWIMHKRFDGAGSWEIFDTMRGWGETGFKRGLSANTTDAENSSLDDYGTPTATGFSFDPWYSDGEEVIFMCIRRPDGYVGKPPELGTGVFNMVMGTSNSDVPAFVSGFVTDFAFNRSPTATEDWWTQSRLTGDKYLRANTTATQGTSTPNKWDYNNGWYAATSDQSSYQSWMWKRHAGFDLVAWAGNNVSPGVIPHSLNKIPEMMWVRKRSDSGDWEVYHKGLNGGSSPEGYSIKLNEPDAEAALGSTRWASTAPTSTHFTVQKNNFNASGNDYIAMLFASVDGISKVGYFDGSDSTQTITTGFQPRFVIIKCTNNVSTSWITLDTTRGWGSGNDNALYLNLSTAQQSWDAGAPTSTGFTLPGNSVAINKASKKYIYYAHS